MHGSYSDTAIIGDILAIMLICYQVINSVKISFLGDVRGLKSTNLIGNKNPLY